MMKKQALLTIGSSKIVISFSSVEFASDICQVKNAIFRESSKNIKIHELLKRNGDFALQKFHPDFEEYIDLKENSRIPDKSKLNVVFLKNSSVDFVGNGQQGTRSSLFRPSKHFPGPSMGRPQYYDSPGPIPSMGMSKFSNFPTPMGRGSIPSSSYPTGSSLPMPLSLQPLNRMSGIPGTGKIGPEPTFQGGNFLGRLGKGIPPMDDPNRSPEVINLDDEPDELDFSRPFHEQRRSFEPSEKLIHLENLLGDLERREREKLQSPSIDRYHRRSRSRSREYRRRRRSPSSQYHRRRLRSRSSDDRRERSLRGGRVHDDHYDSDWHRRHRDESHSYRRGEGSYPLQGGRSLRQTHETCNLPQENLGDAVKKMKYTWDEVLEWEDDELGFKYKEPAHIRKIYDAAKFIRCKQPVQLLNELAQKKEWKSPIFTLTVDGTGTRDPAFQYQVEVGGEIYEAERYSQNKKQAKVYAAIKALYNLKVI